MYSKLFSASFFSLSSVLLSFGSPTYIFQISVEALTLSQVFKPWGVFRSFS